MLLSLIEMSRNRAILIKFIESRNNTETELQVVSGGERIDISNAEKAF